MKREEYITAVRKGGLIDLENGVHRSGKPITSAVREITDGRGKVTVTYADGCVYTFNCDRAETDNKITLTNISEAWYNGKDTVTLGGG